MQATAEISIADFFDLADQGGTYEVETPNGWVEIGDLVKKKRDCYVIRLRNGKSVCASHDHLFMTNDGWKETEDIDVQNDKLHTSEGPQDVVSKEYVGERQVFDLEVLHDGHSYYTNGFVSHNSGKTSTLQILTSKIIKRNGIVVSVYNPAVAAIGLHTLRNIEPKRSLIAVLEDIDAIAEHFESDLLSLLDGEHQIDNLIFIATTNYPERLDPRLANRPSRFDLIQKIGMPNEEARALYLSTKSKRLGADEKLLKQWVQDSEGFSIAHLKELIISVEVFRNDYDASIDRLKTMMDLALSSREYNSKSMGFVNQK